MRLLTTDIYEGAYLLSQGMYLEKLWQNRKTIKRTIVFEFAGDNAETLRSKYQQGRAEANVLRLKQCINELKDRMFNQLRRDEIEIRGNHEYSHARV